MTDKEKIIAEIERLKAEAFNNINHDAKRDMVTDVANSQRIAICEQLLHFIDSLPAEQPSEDLEKAAKDFVEKNSPYTDEFMLDNEVEEAYKIAELTFKRGAQWQKEQIINKASQWLNENVVEYHPRTGKLRPIVNINAFREAMEKEDEQ